MQAGGGCFVSEGAEAVHKAPYLHIVLVLPVSALRYAGEGVTIASLGGAAS